MAGYFYILASRRHGTLYAGCTTDLPKRTYEHREGLAPGFTRRYGIKRLVHVETYEDVSDAIVRERRVKEWKRAWKIQLIEEKNPFWDDLAVSLLGFEPLPPPTGPAERRAMLEQLRGAAKGTLPPGLSGARSQDFLYDEETGLPK